MKLVLIDAHNYLYRAFYAIRGLSNSAGEPSNAIYGFLKMLLKLIRDEAPTHLAVVFDSGKPSFRTEIYPEYKATRSPMPPELVFQLPFIKEFVQALNIKHFEKNGVEADDILATLAAAARDTAQQVIIASGDKDLLQLVDDKIFVLAEQKNRILFQREAVKEKMGVWPGQVIDYLALKGDSSDNIPGVPGIGEKSANTLLNEFNNLDEIYEQLDHIKSASIRRKLQNGRENAYLSKRLATIDQNITLTIDWNELELASADNERLLPLLKRFEFHSLLKDYITIPPQELSFEFLRVSSETEWEQAISEMAKKKLVAVDWLINDDRSPDSELVGVALFDGLKITYGEFSVLNKSLIKGLTQLGHGANIVVGCGIKALYFLAYRNKLELTDKFFDIKIASYLINPLKRRYHLGDIWGDISEQNKLTDIKEMGLALMDESQPERLEALFCQRLKAIYDSYAFLSQKLEQTDLLTLYTEIEQPLTRILAQMEYHGIKVVKEKLADIEQKVDQRLAVLTEEIFNLAGESFNINSSQQLGVILFEKLGLPVKRKTKTGFSTDMDTLEALRNEHELPEMIIQYRQLAKLKSTYLETLPLMIHPSSDRIHSSFHQTGTATGRLSSSDPNLQNIPLHSDTGKEIRSAFVSEEGWSLLGADYSQMELRVLADFSDDETLSDAFLNGEDIHTRTAAEIFHCFPQMVTRQMRQSAKAVNFGVIYGLSAFALAKQLSISRKEAASIIERYFERYENVREYIKGVITQAKVDGFVRTLKRRRRPLPEILSPNRGVREFNERAALNTVIQGSSADIIKLAMVNIDRQLRVNNFQTRLLLQIHDELIYEVPDNEFEQVKLLVIKEMEQAVSLSVPLEVNVSSAKEWASLH